MALPIKIIKLNSSENLETFRNGGKGSGNFGHAGRPGEIGGSAPAGTTSSSQDLDTSPSASDKSRKGEHPFSNEILDRAGVNLDAENDVIYLNDDSHKTGREHYYEWDDNEKERVDKENKYTYDWGAIQFGVPGDQKGWSDAFRISGNYKGSRKEHSQVQVSTTHAYDDADYYWAFSNDKKNYTIVLKGKKVGEFKTNPPEHMIAGDKIAVSCDLLEHLTELNKKIEPRYVLV